MNPINLIKIALVILLFGCLADMPYGYFQLVRFASMAGFAYLAYATDQQGGRTEAIIFVVLALLFQPFIKVSLGRELWNIVDVIVGLYLLGSLLMNKEEKNSN